MDHRLVLVKAITLLYRESTWDSKDSNSSDLVRTALAGIKLPEVSLSVSSERQIIMALRDTVQYMCDNPVDHVYEREDLLQRLKVNCGEDDKLYEAFSQGIERDLDEAGTRKVILNIRKYINDTFRETEIINLFSKSANQLRFQREAIPDIRAFVADFKTKLEPYEMQATGKDPAIVSSVDLGDKVQLLTVLNEVQEISNEVGILRFGWQAMNNMCQGGIRRGECMSLAALQHNYKTGTGLSLFKQIAMYNEPRLTNPTKKPLLLRYSFEDSLTSNIRFLYENIFQNVNGELPNMKKTSVDIMQEFIKKHMQATGFEVRMLRIDPSQWTYRHIQNSVVDLEAQGYEIHLLALDYLAMVPTTGCIQGASGDDIRDLWRRMRNFCSARGIAMMSPHQLSSDAKQLLRDGRGSRGEFVKLVANKGYYDGCKRLDQEIDLEIYTHIEEFNGESFLNVQRGKHRGVSHLKERDRYFILPFTEKGCILDDINGPDSSRKKMGGGPVGSPDEVPYFDLEGA